jgi:hypothetical protein
MVSDEKKWTAVSIEVHVFWSVPHVLDFLALNDDFIFPFIIFSCLLYMYIGSGKQNLSHLTIWCLLSLFALPLGDPCHLEQLRIIINAVGYWCMGWLLVHNSLLASPLSSLASSHTMI